MNAKTFVSTVAEIFTFIGSDPDKAVSREYTERHSYIRAHPSVLGTELLTI